MKVQLIGSCDIEDIEERERIISSAAALSRFKGKASEVYGSRDNPEKNRKLIKNVIGYGHKSILDHCYLVFALDDISPVMEQTIIQKRLSSFTIQSRREVDFRNVGFYEVEHFHDKDGNIHKNDEKLKQIYNNHMKDLFNLYGDLVDENIDFEDARYILPYCFHANHIMGMDARSLISLIVQLTSGKVSDIPEAKELGEKLKEELVKALPAVKDDILKEEAKRKEEEKDKFKDFREYIKDTNREILDNVQLENATEEIDNTILISAIMQEYQVSSPKAYKILDEIEEKDPNFRRKLMKVLLHHSENRELEQVNFTFDIPISLAVLTHLTRHRMQSLLVPDFVPLWDLDSYIIPDDIKEREDLNKRVEDAFEMTKEIRDLFIKEGVNENELVYFYLAGNKCNVRTTMNGKELKYLLNLRMCKKTQWETRRIANQMQEEVSKVAPLFAEGLGPNCVILGKCTEGRDNCTKKRIKY